ncbi:MAG: outer membrane protein [Alphaproteobacteria bacterium]
MKKFRHAIIAAAAIVMGSVTANAAGLIPIPVEPVPIPEPISAREYYLKAFIGITNQEIDTFTNEGLTGGGPFTIVNHDFDSSPFIGFGIGVKHSDRFRFDLTGEYRGKSDFTGLDTYVDPFCGPGVCTNEHSGIKSEWLFLASAYWDIGNYRGITPYVGAGIGTAAVSLDGFRDVNLVTNGLHYARDNTEWNLAWALHAGLSYDIAPDLVLDLGYRFTYLGDGKTGTYDTYDPAAPQGRGATTLEDIVSHDVMVGLRWNFGQHDCCVPEAMPIAYK